MKNGLEQSRFPKKEKIEQSTEEQQKGHPLWCTPREPILFCGNWLAADFTLSLRQSCRGCEALDDEGD